MTQPHSTAKGEAIGLVVKLPFATPEEFVARYGANVTRGGIYLRAKTVKPPGSTVTLDLKLADGSRIIHATAVIHFVTGQAGQGVSGIGAPLLAALLLPKEEPAAATATPVMAPPMVAPAVGAE